MPTNVHSLPNEILCDIFLIFIRDLPPLHNHIGFYLKPTPGVGPLLLSQICSQWRIIVTRFSLIWSYIYIVDVPARILELWLERSQTYPLSFILELTASIEALYLLMAQEYRWKSVGVYKTKNFLASQAGGELAEVDDHLHALFSAGGSNMLTLEPRVTYRWSYYEVEAKPINQRVAASLVFEIQPSNLKELITDISLDLNLFINVLSVCNRLASASFGCINPAKQAQTTNPASLPNLQHLRFSADPSVTQKLLLERLSGTTLPKLQSLWVLHSSSQAQNPLNRLVYKSIATFFTNNAGRSPNLRKLCLFDDRRQDFGIRGDFILQQFREAQEDLRTPRSPETLLVFAASANAHIETGIKSLVHWMPKSSSPYVTNISPVGFSFPGYRELFTASYGWCDGPGEIERVVRQCSKYPDTLMGDE